MTYTEAELKMVAEKASAEALYDYMRDERRGGMNAAKDAGYEMYSTLASCFCVLYNRDMDLLEEKIN